MGGGAAKEDVILTFSTDKVVVTNSKGSKTINVAEKLADLFVKGSNTISFKMSKNGYIVSVNDKELIDPDAVDDTLIASTIEGGYEKANTFTVKGLDATLVTYSVDKSDQKI